jgi:protein-S-isoprenylcysteine O-methyltransferase Ste14
VALWTLPGNRSLPMSTLELKIPPLILAILLGIATWLLARAVPALTFDMPAQAVVAIVLAASGAAFVIAAVLQFRRAGTTVDPRTPDATRQVVTTGVYRLTRNPMYLGFVLLLTGGGVYLGNLLALLLVPAFVVYLNRFQIRPEERALLQHFGPPYAEYLRSVRRWL